MKKQKAILQVLRCEINGAVFEAEGDAAEVGAKFTKWLDEQFARISKLREIASNKELP